jgi:hypothetical protein
MTAFPKIVATALAAASAAPAAAQYPYPYPQQPYPPGYPYQTYPYQQPYGGTVVDQVLNQLLGNYNVNERQAIRSCARAAIGRAQAQYRGYGYNQGYGGYPPGYAQPYGYGYNQGIAAPMMRVTAITDVERRSYGLRVRGLIDTGMYGYNPNYNRGYAAGDLKFRCSVDYRGYVSDVRVDRNDEWRRY